MVDYDEDFVDQLRRVRMMSTDDGDTWDLSSNDKAALEAVLASHQRHFDHANALDAENSDQAKEIIALMRKAREFRQAVDGVAAGMTQALNAPILWRTTDEFMATVAHWRAVLWNALEAK